MSTAGNEVEPEELQEEEEEEEGGGGNPRRCAACKYLRRRCGHGCALAPYFPASRPRRYANVHRVFGASNVARLLQSLPVEERAQAAETMAMEAQWRVGDPVYGCAGVINRLQEEILATQCELARTRAQLAIVVAHGAQQAPRSVPLPPPHSPLRAGGDRVAGMQRQGGQQDVPLDGPFIDTDEFLDLDGF
ncbi:hypothetical protein CFC21_072393 [Triticum aestivum]|uniref:LOB domain-containing protein n=3 Tax=Triticum TaxID=4564 RepID=A0A9R0XCT6_TRITD|nr:hypothetical protein CFC21_072393 [Triticum aestivum]VAI34184.1 unnamed protein product [Triticum turgidum subsp. durum]